MNLNYQEYPVIKISDLGRSGLTFNWDKIELGNLYFISRENILLMDNLFHITAFKISKKAIELNSEVIMWEDIKNDGWLLLLRNKIKIQNNDKN